MAQEPNPSPEDRPPNWNEEQYSLVEDHVGVLAKIAEAAVIPLHPGVRWGAAVVTMIGKDSAGRTMTYLQYIQDTDWKVSERDVLRYLIRQIRDRIGI